MKHGPGPRLRGGGAAAGRPRIGPARWGIALLLSAGLGVHGCQLGGMALDQLPKPDVPAVYDPPNRMTLVLVDDPGERLPSSPLGMVIAERIARDLTRSGTIEGFVASREVDEARRSHEDFDRWPIARAGEHFGAEQVIHVSIERFDFGDYSSELVRPTASAQVKLIEVDSGRRLFPADNPEGHALTTRMYYRDAGRQTRGASGELTRRLADMLGTDVAKVFYKHPPRRIGSGWQD